MIVLGLRKNRCPDVRRVMLQHLNHQLVLTGMTIWMTSCPPNHVLQHMIFLPLYMNLESEKRQRERQEVRQVMLHHLQHKLVNWDDDMDDFMPPKPWPPTHDVPPPVHESRIRKETKGNARGSSSHVAPPAAQTCVNWDDDMDDFMPPNHGLQHMMFLPLYMNVDPEKRERDRQEVRRAILHHLQYHHLSTGMMT